MHYLSVLAIFKNETDNLKVWIDHYLWQGVEHFYLIDNDSTDNPLEILQDYIDKGIVSYYYKAEKHKQAEHYRWVFDTENLKNNTYWLIVCDMDEFLYSDDLKKSIIDFYESDATLIKPTGYDMIVNEFEFNYNDKLTNLVKTGYKNKKQNFFLPFFSFIMNEYVFFIKFKTNIIILVCFRLFFYKVVCSRQCLRFFYFIFST